MFDKDNTSMLAISGYIARVIVNKPNWRHWKTDTSRCKFTYSKSISISIILYYCVIISIRIVSLRWKYSCSMGGIESFGTRWIQGTCTRAYGYHGQNEGRDQENTGKIWTA